MINLSNQNLNYLESEEDLIEVKPRKRQKSKVVQSLKLKFKKEENTKCKDDQETPNETGKSVIRITNEELNSSEMVFFCTPKAESNVKILPKKKTKHDGKESSQSTECEIIKSLYPETSSSNNFYAVVSERNIKTDTKDSLSINTVNNVVKELQTEENFVATVLAVNNLTTEIKTESYSMPPITTNIIPPTTNDTNGINIIPPAMTVNNLRTEIKTESNFEILTKTTGILETHNRQYQTSKEIGEKLTNQFSANSNHVTSLNESDKPIIKNECAQESDIFNINIKNKYINQNISTTDSNFSTATISDMSKLLIDKNLTVQSEPLEITDSSTTNYFPILNTNKSLFNKNVTLKSEAIERLPECYIGVMKQDNNVSEKQLINKWTIDEDKIILQTCKRVEDIEVLLETIKRRIPQRSVSEVRPLL